MGIFTTNISLNQLFTHFFRSGANPRGGRGNWGWNNFGGVNCGGGSCGRGNYGGGGNFGGGFDFRNWRMNTNDIVSLFIYLNVGVFVFVTLVNLFLTLFGVPVNPWVKYLQLPSWLPTLFFQPWSLITYMFLHVGLFHLLFNMLWLLWFGRLFLNFFSSRHFRGLYILGGIYGGLSFVLAYNILPGFEASLPNASLLGASASVLAIVVATAVREPNLPVQFMFLGSVRLKYVALFMLAFDLFFISYENAGGHIAHLGGAAAGWFFAAGLARGVDRTQWINDILDVFSGKLKLNWGKIFGWTKLTERFSKRGPKMNVRYGGKYGTGSETKGAGQTSGRTTTDREKDYEFNAQRNAQQKARQEELNNILDKLRKSGYGSLTNEEKRRLFDQNNE